MELQRGHICQCLSRISSSRLFFTTFTSPTGLPRHKTGLQFTHGVLSLASGLSNLGITPGDIVAIAALNTDLYLEWMLAVAYVGAILAPLNYRWSLEEAKSALEILKPVMLVVDDHCAIYYSMLPSLRWHVRLGNSNGQDYAFDSSPVLTADTLYLPTSQSLHYQWAPDATVLICFTSGTTGTPKGVSITHTSLIVQSLAKIAIVGYTQDDVYLHTAPLCHIGGISSAMAMLMIGASHVLLPKFESKSVLHAIQQYHVSSLITVPAMMSDLISYIRSHRTQRAGESLKKILNGGGQLSNELIMDAAEIFPKAKLISAYGMTETCSSLTFKTLYPSPRSDGKHQKASEGKSVHLGFCVGKPAPHVELVVDRDGRILTRGPHIMLRYWNQNTSEIPDSLHQGWLDTGDIGCLDSNGDLWLIGRSNGRIKSGGENIYPEEVEAVLSCHPGVGGIIVVGVPDARYSEMVVACVQMKERWKWADPEPKEAAEYQLSSESLYNYCREKELTRFKIPKKFIPWMRAFPVTSTGKLKRDQVRREVISLLHLPATRSISSSL
ncbi:o-succinylbenzoate--CoA ligase [Ranunculus cassubicifolius]